MDFPDGTDALIMGVEPFIKSVGRVEFLNHAMTWGGTGWVIAAERQHSAGRDESARRQAGGECAHPPVAERSCGRPSPVCDTE